MHFLHIISVIFFVIKLGSFHVNSTRGPHKVANSHALAMRLMDFDIFLHSDYPSRFSHEFYKIHIISSQISIFLPFVNMELYNLQHEMRTAIMGKYLACVWHNYLCFLPTSLYSEMPKAQTFLLLLFQYGVCCEEDEGCCYLQMQI